MDDAVVLHVFQALHHLLRDGSELRGLKNRLLEFVDLNILVQIEMEHLKYYYHVLSELEAVQILNDSVFALRVRI